MLDTEGPTHQGSGGTPLAGSPSITPTPSPPKQRNPPKQAGRALASKGSSSSIRLTGSKRALSSRSNQDSARQLMTKQRIGRASAVGTRPSAEARRSSGAAVADGSRTMNMERVSGQVAGGSAVVEGAAARAGAEGQQDRALLRQSVDLTQGRIQAVHTGRVESQGGASKAAAAKKGVSQKVSLSSMGWISLGCSRELSKLNSFLAPGDGATIYFACWIHSCITPMRLRF